VWSWFGLLAWLWFGAEDGEVFAVVSVFRASLGCELACALAEAFMARLEFAVVCWRTLFCLVVCALLRGSVSGCAARVAKPCFASWPVTDRLSADFAAALNRMHQNFGLP